MRLLFAIGVAAAGLGACGWAVEPPARFSAPAPQAQSASIGRMWPVSADESTSFTSTGSTAGTSRRPLEEIADHVARALLGKQVPPRVRRGMARQAARLARRFLGQLGIGGDLVERLRGLRDQLRGSAGGLRALLRGAPRIPRGLRRGYNSQGRDAPWRRLRRSRCWKGDVSACRLEALAFDEAGGGGRTSVRARIYYRKACRLGHGPSCADLGAIYESGRGLAGPLPRLASRYYAKACAAGAQRGCREGLRLGRGVPATRPWLRWRRPRQPGLRPPATGAYRTIRI